MIRAITAAPERATKVIKADVAVTRAVRASTRFSLWLSQDEETSRELTTEPAAALRPAP